MDCCEPDAGKLPEVLGRLGVDGVPDPDPEGGVEPPLGDPGTEGTLGTEGSVGGVLPLPDEPLGVVPDEPPVGAGEPDVDVDGSPPDSRLLSEGMVGTAGMVNPEGVVEPEVELGGEPAPVPEPELAG